MAWAQHRGISKVEVGIDDEFRSGRTGALGRSRHLAAVAHRRLAADPGQASLAVRATDGTGAVQTDVQADPVPDGAPGWSSTAVTVT